MTDFITTFSKQLIQNGLASRWTISGCSDYEIQELEKHFEIKLPTIYRDFLKKMGKGAGKFMLGTDAFYSRLFDNREGLLEVLDGDDYPFVLKEDAFVFSSHQGYIFHFFDTSEDIFDPPVYVYAECDLKLERLSESYSSFLSRLLSEEMEIWNSLNR